MHSWLQYSDCFLFEPVSKLVLDNDITFALSYEINLIIFFGEIFILLTEHSLWSLEHSIHPLHYVIDHFVVIGRAV